MSEEVRVEPGRIGDLAKSSLDASNKVGDTVHGSGGALSLPAGAFGNTENSDTIQQIHASTHEAAKLAMGAFAEVYGNDGDLLYQTSAAYQATDAEGGASIDRLGTADAVTGGTPRASVRPVGRRVIRRDPCRRRVRRTPSRVAWPELFGRLARTAGERGDVGADRRQARPGAVMVVCAVS